jgi:hypothetical protein
MAQPDAYAPSSSEQSKDEGKSNPERTLKAVERTGKP